MMKLRERLTYANVTATVALVIALGAGGAVAADLIGSRQIADDSIRSVDLRNGAAVRGVDVRPDGLGGRQIREMSLNAAEFAPAHGQQRASCDPSGATFTICATSTLHLQRRSRAVAIGTGGFYGDGGPDPVSATCELRVDNVPGMSQTPGEVTANTNATATDGFARTLVTGILPSGMHKVTLECNELGGDAKIRSPTIAAFALTAR